MPGRLERLHQTPLSDNRTAAQVDRDRVLYSAAFRRLAHVTQVVGADQVHNFYNRLTHTLQVAQVARRAAESLLKDSTLSVHICPDICETAALAHDLGHPPFGHLAEKVLNRVATREGLSDGFEGNAQSFRIVTKLAAFNLACEGLDLTRASLNALLKYPWPRNGNSTKPEKWGAYDSEREEMEWARSLSPSGSLRPTLEAQIMDWADDVTYSVHDVEDFYKAGYIPLHKFPTSLPERETFYAGLFTPEKASFAPDTENNLIATFEGMAKSWTDFTNYTGSYAQRQTLKSVASELIASFVRTLDVRQANEELNLHIEQAQKNIIYILKEMTSFYVFENPLLKNMQQHQEAMVEGLFNIYLSAAKNEQFALFPTLTAERLKSQDSGTARVREIIDLLATMTEFQITQTFHCLSGTYIGSNFVHPIG